MNAQHHDPSFMSLPSSPKLPLKFPIVSSSSHKNRIPWRSVISSSHNNSYIISHILIPGCTQFTYVPIIRTVCIPIPRYSQNSPLTSTRFIHSKDYTCPRVYVFTYNCIVYSLHFPSGKYSIINTSHSAHHCKHRTKWTEIYKLLACATNPDTTAGQPNRMDCIFFFSEETLETCTILFKL